MDPSINLSQLRGHSLSITCDQLRGDPSLPRHIAAQVRCRGSEDEIKNSIELMDSMIRANRRRHYRSYEDDDYDDYDDYGWEDDWEDDWEEDEQVPHQEDKEPPESPGRGRYHTETESSIEAGHTIGYRHTKSTTHSHHTGISIPDDLLNILALHVDHSVLLAFLAARPHNSSLIRSLYNHRSPFWNDRLGAQTGRGCMVDRVTGLPHLETQSTDALHTGSDQGGLNIWTPRVQCNALVPRSGYLITSSSVGGNIVTNIRVKGVVEKTDEEGGQFAYWPNTDRMSRLYGDLAMSVEFYMRTEVVALWEDGIVRQFSQAVPMRTVAAYRGSRSRHDKPEYDKEWILQAMKKRLEDVGEWAVVTRFQYNEGADNQASPPRMRQMVPIGWQTQVRGDVVIAYLLDYDGRLWFLSQSGAKHSQVGPIKMGLIALGQDVGPIQSIVPVTAPTDTTIYPSSLYTNQAYKRMVVASTTDGREYIVVIPNGRTIETEHIPYILSPIVVPIPAMATLAAHTLPTSPSMVRQRINDGDEILQPTVPYLIWSPSFWDDGADSVRALNEWQEDVLSSPITARANDNLDVLVTKPFVDAPTRIATAPSKADGPATNGDMQLAIDHLSSVSGEQLSSWNLIPVLPKWGLGSITIIQEIMGQDTAGRTKVTARSPEIVSTFVHLAWHQAIYEQKSPAVSALLPGGRVASTAYHSEATKIGTGYEAIKAEDFQLTYGPRRATLLLRLVDDDYDPISFVYINTSKDGVVSGIGV